MRNRLLLLICLAAAVPAAARARTAAESYAADGVLEEVIVVAARLPRPAADVVGTVDIVSRENLRESLAVRMADAVRYVPGVSVTQDGTRFGDSGFTIRGLSGNRVLQLVDGIPLADQFDIGEFSDATQDYFVPDAVARIEILRGPASTLFGSDALGGVVAVLTREPAEFLDGEPSRMATSAAWSGADDGRTINASLAAAGNRLAGVLHVSRLDGHELESAAPGPEDAVDRRRGSVLAKATWALDNGDRLRLRADGYRDDVASDLTTVLGYGRRYADTTSLRGDDTRRRWSAALGYDVERDDRSLGTGRLDLFVASTRTEQRTHELREAAVPPLAIEREFRYEQDLWGVVGDFESRFELRGSGHRLGWGFSLDQRRVEELRDGLSTDLATGAQTTVLLGESMPVRDFPESTVSELGVYVHDEVAVGRAMLIPGLRFDAYAMDAHADAVYRVDNPDTAVVDLDQSAWSPKLALRLPVGDALTAFAQYAHGFRAAPFEDVNIGFDLPLFNYRAIPNPDLRPESSDGLELGLRFESARLRWSASLFGALYDDFIESRVNLGPDPETGTLIFQSRNVAEARVYGAELELAADLDRWLTGLSVSVASNWTRGENEQTGAPLNSVDPPEAVVRVAWAPRATLRFALMTTLVADQDRIDESMIDLFAPDGYVAVDALATLEASRNVRVDLGVFNLLDETYWRWSAVRNRPADDPMIGALSAPGRYASAAVHVTF
jgi:hemoglobin/transferrin/lactoferrin receptor protein